MEDGGRQNSSKASARRDECMWMYVADESRDMIMAKFVVVEGEVKKGSGQMEMMDLGCRVKYLDTNTRDGAA